MNKLYTKSTHKLFEFKNSCLGFFFLFFIHVNVNAQNATQVNLSGSSSVININNNTATVVDPNLVLTANGNIPGFIVSITGSYTTGDVLGYTGSLPSGITAAAFNTATRSLVFSGTTTAANWQTLLRTVTLTTTSAICNPESRFISFVVGLKYYNILNGHFYEYYSTTLSWTSANTYASGLSYYGCQGYIATVTAASENSFNSVLVGQNSWIGCSDNYLQINAALGYTLYATQALADGNFYWITGPERGLKISSQNAWQAGGALPVSGVYSNWTSGEPNDWPGLTTGTPGQEDYGHMYTGTALWNDFPNTTSIGTIIEYGGMPGDNTTSQMVHTRSVNINGAPSGTITGGTSVCAGTNSTTLTLTGLSGTVVRWESSLDNFLTAGTTIANTTTSLTVNNISTTTYYRAIVNSSSGCTNLATSSETISVTTTVSGNIVAANSAICAGSAASFTLFGHSGSVVKWQVSTSSTFASSVTDISNTTTTMSYTLGSNGTYYFRAVVQNGGCGSPVNTPGFPITVTTGTSPVGGSVSSASHCGGASNSGTLTLSGHTGTIQKWQYSLDGAITWTDVANTTTSLNYTGIGANRHYRAVLINGACGTAYSSNGLITVYGTTVTRWDGGTSNAWQTSSNWCGGIAANGIDVVISSSASNHIILDQNRTIGTLNFNGSGRNITIGNYDLTTSSISNANSSSYIKTNGSGVLKINIPNTASVTFAVGDQAYNPVTITNNTGSADYLSARVLNEVFYNGTSGFTSPVGRVKRTWDISKTNANGGSGLNFVFNWNVGESVSLVTPTLFHYESGNWVQQLGSTTIIGTSLTYIGYTGTFSPFSIGSSAVVLSADLMDFEAKAQISSHSVLLSWKTSSEENNHFFEVQRSTDGQNWQNIGRVEGHGNSNSVNAYMFIDQHPELINFYRLRQVNFDGQSLFHVIRKVDFNAPADDIVSVYPNPSNGIVNIITSEPSTYAVYDMNGRSIMEGIVNGLTILNDIPAGFYLVSITTGESVYHVKLTMK